MEDPLAIPPEAMRQLGYRRPPAAVVTGSTVTRCWWATSDPAYIAYHDDEWGRPVTDDRTLFEKLCLEGFQAGLSWLTILRKRERFRQAFAGFDPAAVAAFGPEDEARLLADPGIVRNRGKIAATIGNARAALEVGSLRDVVWAFAPEPGPPRRSPGDVPAITPESQALSRELKRLGFRFVGPTTVYAFMQAMGLVNDHLRDCMVHAACATEQAAARLALQSDLKD